MLDINIVLSYNNSRITASAAFLLQKGVLGLDEGQAIGLKNTYTGLQLIQVIISLIDLLTNLSKK
jgi:prenyltransferase beta subunit